MSDPTLHALLGELKGQVSSLQSQMAKSEDDATKSRKALYTQISDMRSEVQDTRLRTAALEVVMENDVRPAVKMLSDWRSRALGGIAVLGIIGAVILLILGAAKDAIIEIGRAIFGR
ncbi:DUF1515 family protein [Pararhodobacter sp.]|uniref:DUF1515 family protein n=1 Tax=Pararhodobacter sp. TaxID=2127056 RepID=UPI002FDCA71B